MPADPTLTGCAERVEVELRQQVSDEVGAAFDVEPPPGLAQRADFQALDAQVEPGGMIVAGVHYATRRGRRRAAPAARARPVRAGAALGARVRPPRARRRRPHRRPTPVPAHRRVEHKRRALDRLARRWAQLRREIDPGYTGRRRRRASTARWASPAAPTPASRSSTTASTFLRRELGKLARDYPEQAERLRIPASVEAIDGRLGVANGESPGSAR